jgi:phosphoglucosamine mutase
MVSASHNPYFDNGIKIFNSKGFKIREEIEEQIEAYIDSPFDILALPKNDAIGKLYSNEDLKNLYIEFLVSKATTSFKGIKVALDCANGASYEIAKRVFSKLDADVVYYNDKPDGININEGCGSTHMSYLDKKSKKISFDIGFAFDGDADRVLAYSPTLGVVDGDALMYLNARSLKYGNSLKGNTVVLTIMSNLGLKKALKEKGISYVETKVGDKYVQECLERDGYCFGGEQSGHIIFYDDLATGDGILSAIKTLNLLAETGKSIETLLKDFRSFPQALKNVTVTNKEAVMKNVGLLDVIASKEKELKGDGRIVVRPSGTEPFVRVMCEAPTKEICEQVCNDIKEYIESLGY